MYVLYFKDYIDGIEKHGSYIWKPITQGPHKFTKTKESIYSQEDYELLHEKYIHMTVGEKEKLENEVKEMSEILFSLAQNTFRLVSSCKYANDIWKRLKELYLDDDDQLHSVQNCVSFGVWFIQTDEWRECISCIKKI